MKCACLDHTAVRSLWVIMVKIKQTEALHCKRSDYTLSQPKALKEGSMCKKQLNMWKQTVQLGVYIQQLHCACERNGRHINTCKSTSKFKKNLILMHLCSVPGLYHSPWNVTEKSPWVVCVYRIFICIMCEYCNIICQQWWCPSDRAVLIQVMNRGAKTMKK